MRGVIVTVLSLSLPVILAQPATAQDQYLRLVGNTGMIRGDVPTKGYEDWIDISAWGIGFQTSIGSGGGGVRGGFN